MGVSANGGLLTCWETPPGGRPAGLWCVTHTHSRAHVHTHSHTLLCTCACTHTHTPVHMCTHPQFVRSIFVLPPQGTSLLSHDQVGPFPGSALSRTHQAGLPRQRPREGRVWAPQRLTGKASDEALITPLSTAQGHQQRYFCRPSMGKAHLFSTHGEFSPSMVTRVYGATSR